MRIGFAILRPSNLLNNTLESKDNMLNRSLTLSVVVTAAVLVLTVATPAIARDQAEQSAEQSQTLKVECTSGAYGQDSNCKAEGTQTQKLHQLISYTKVLGASKIHTPVDTAVDSRVLLACFATGLIGVGAFAGYLRIR